MFCLEEEEEDATFWQFPDRENGGRKWKGEGGGDGKKGDFDPLS